MDTKPTLKDWITATRPWSFPVSSLPAVIGVIYSIYKYSDCAHNWWLGVFAVIGAVIFHAGGNLISDYNDYKYGVDRQGKVGTDILTSGLFRPKQVLAYGWTFITIGILIGLFLVWQSGIELLWIGLIGAIGAIFYYGFKFKALGDLLIFVVYGPVIVMGASYTMLGFIDWKLALVSLPLAFITVGVLHANNTRDIKSDGEAGITTLAMLLGFKLSAFYYYKLMVLAYVAIVAMVIFDILPLVSLITLITAPIAFKNCKAMSKVTPDDVTPINELDKNTAQLQLMFSATLLLSLIIAIVI